MTSSEFKLKSNELAKEIEGTSDRLITLLMEVRNLHLRYVEQGGNLRVGRKDECEKCGKKMMPIRDWCNDCISSTPI